MNEPQVLTIKQAAAMLKVGDQAAREMIKAGCIKGASAFGSNKHRHYYITDQQIINFMKGEHQ